MSRTAIDTETNGERPPPEDVVEGGSRHPAGRTHAAAFALAPAAPRRAVLLGLALAPWRPGRTAPCTPSTREP
ncbi:hypothetical protein [Streptomyces sp. LMG1-1-1.1]|uniref:hypothetical protein n=1 Tax=Streptomyces sp. LMG1-1-1.1 TaxID=3135245 RepID=UPI00346697B9